MKRIKEIFIKMKEQLYEALKRFPETLVLCFTFGGLAIWLNHLSYYETDSRELISRLMMAVFLGVWLSANVKLISERFEKPHLRWVADGIVIGLMIVFYMIIPNPITALFAWRFSVSIVSLIVAFSLVLFWPKYEHYPLSVLKLLADGAVTLLFTLVMFAGVSAILFALKELLGISIPQEWYLDSLIILATVFAPTYFLSKMIVYQGEISLYGFSSIFKVLIGRIIMPLLTVYTLILYAYFIRLIFEGKLPEGMLGNLVIWYGLITVLMLFFSYTIKDEKPFYSWFHQWMPKIMLLPLAMMFLALYIRIDAYGITVRRYFVFALGLWVLGNALYWCIKKERTMQYVAASAIVIMLLSLYGPWSAYPVSIWHQNQRFEKVLVELDLLQEGSIVPNQALSEIERARVNGFISYFDSQHNLSDLRYLPEGFSPFEDMKRVFGFSYVGYYRDSKVYMNVWADQGIRSRAIGGYGKVYFVEAYGVERVSESSNSSNEPGLVIKDMGLGVVEVLDSRGELLSLPVGEWIWSLWESTEAEKRLEPEKAWIEKTVQGRRILINIQNAGGWLDENGNRILERMQFVLFVE